MSYQLLLTNAGAAKIATASNAGGTPLHITDFAVGQGVNVDFSTRLDKQTLVAKRYQGKVESVNLVAPNKYEIACVVPVDVGGFTIREMGLIDSDGVLVWVGSLPEVQKPDATSTAAVDYRLKAVVQIDNPAVSIVVDTNVVTATQSWVNSTISKQFTDFQALFNSWQQSINQDLALVKNRKIEPVSIGGLLITTRNYANSQEVHDGEGYGKWAKFSEGQLLLGIGSHTDKNGVTKNISMMQQLGEYEHRLTIDEMPSHNHAYGGEYGGTKNTGTAVQSYEPWEEAGNVSSGKTLETGANKPHNNIQPSIGVGMWLRLPDDYTATSFDIYFTSDALGQNRVGQINEDSAIYLWIDVANATVPITVSAFNQQGAGDFISDGANLTYPPTINNGKNLMIGVLPENYHVDMQTIIDWGFTLFDAAIGKTQNIHAGLTINDTVSDAPPVEEIPGRYVIDVFKTGEGPLSVDGNPHGDYYEGRVVKNLDNLQYGRWANGMIGTAYAFLPERDVNANFWPYWITNRASQVTVYVENTQGLVDVNGAPVTLPNLRVENKGNSDFGVGMFSNLYDYYNIKLPINPNQRLYRIVLDYPAP